MTTNQTIDGVPRACDALKCLTESFRHALQRGIQPSFSMGDLEFFIKTFEELRALLDAPAKAEFSIPDCPDCACVQDGQCLCIPSKPAAQPQGEPVAEIVSKYGDPEAFGERELITLKDISKFPYGTKLYADQPAPVAVVLPPKLKSPAFKTVDRGSVNYAAGWNAYANELKRLNPSL
ncbi:MULTISPECIES: hypothetical protein [unclassified Pseudomonas]|jgi:hypothetical protein|uniref:hypothetical protein n=1 Tax=unclassified Pseudomonas TaxID=196821 RepID=UPI000C882FAD|nr:MULTISPECIES: hypothetical protein [unclassified Pseudomonas]MBL1311224.1 hypothetical protein [Pseudomonas sp.]PMX19145.1 hypothetical protein C1Y25_00650 [Pseudomonas sp. MPBC4-3]PMX50106.1 hypothetical protein C1Y20_04365 [Pseudomonas sp. FW301-21B01]PMY10822.1 hypothetical protein C1Y18_02195 [Pseudomonas sp. MPR-R5A]PNA72989.1 hypothetical protein C1Y14_01750 [Pseudomonas sp. MPR-R5B]